jgi:sulfur carrier protein
MCLSVKRHSGRKVNILMADIMFNGKKRDIKDNTNITEFITINSYKPEHVVVELNEEIISKERYQEIILKDNDVLEVLSFMGGG